MSTTMTRTEGIIDVERRKSDAEYTLGDPTVFPPEFLTWLKRYIEQSGIQLPASSIFGTFQPGAGLSSVAAGCIFAFAGPVVPAGSLPCNGQSVGRDAYPKLFDAIGVTYGSVDAASFTLPDYRDRTLFGIGATLTAVIQNDAMPLGQRGPQHRHSITDPGHDHDAKGGDRGSGTFFQISPGVSYNQLENTLDPGTIQPRTTGISVGPGARPLDAPAYHAVNYVITTG